MEMYGREGRRGGGRGNRGGGKGNRGGGKGKRGGGKGKRNGGKFQRRGGFHEGDSDQSDDLMEISDCYIGNTSNKPSRDSLDFIELNPNSKRRIYANETQRHPPGLRGKAIGLWYAKQYKDKNKSEDKKKRKEENEREPCIALTLDQAKERTIRKLVDSIKTPLQVPIQTSIPERQIYKRYRSRSPSISNSPMETKPIKKEETGEFKPINTIKKEETGEFKPINTASDLKPLTVSEKYKHMEESPFKKIFLRSITGNLTENVDNALQMKSKLSRNHEIDRELKEELMKKQRSSTYQRMQEFRRKLPAWEKREELLQLLENNQVLVISGETGCGKTTQVAQFILDSEIEKGAGSACHVVCTQPRRISAISVAERVAAERDERVGRGSTGYVIRLEAEAPRPRGSIKFCTTGVLLRMLEQDAALTEISHLILDEIHERDTISDFAITILKDIIPKRPDLRLILMSATLNAESFSQYYNNCVMVNIPGFTFPVVEYYLEDVLQMTGFIPRLQSSQNQKKRKKGKEKFQDIEFRGMVHPYLRDLASSNKYSSKVINHLYDPGSENINLELILELIKYIDQTQGDGAILVFLPGWDKIATLNKLLKEARMSDRSGYVVIPLHSMLSTVSQRSVFERPPRATNHYGDIVSTVQNDWINLPTNCNHLAALLLHTQQIAEWDENIALQTHRGARLDVSTPTVKQMGRREFCSYKLPYQFGVRKIVIATNIAETSITIDDVVFVIDCGKIKMKNFDVNLNISTLKEEWVSLANARQRKGRSGRVKDGVCYHMFTRARELLLDPYPVPEMLRTRLEEVILQAKMLQLGTIKPFLSKVMNPPNLRAIDLSLKLLQDLNALDSDENLTPLGYHLAKLPMDPQTGKMILMGSLFCVVDPIFSVAASLSFKDAFTVPLEREREFFKKKKELALGTKSDHLVFAEALTRWELESESNNGWRFAREYFLSSSTLKLLSEMKNQFVRHLHEMKFLSSDNARDQVCNQNSNNIGLIKAIICAGLYPNVAIIRNVKKQNKSGRVLQKIFTPEDGRVYLHFRSINYDEVQFESRFLVYHMKMKTTQVNLYDTTMVFALPMIFFGHNFELFKENGNVVIELSPKVRFTCSASTALLVKELRQRLDQLLEYKVAHPGITDWNETSDEGKLLKAIAELISHEDEKLTMIDDSDEEDFDEEDDDESDMGGFATGAQFNYHGGSERYDNKRYQHNSGNSRTHRTHQSEFQQAGPSRGRFETKDSSGVVPFPRF